MRLDAELARAAFESLDTTLPLEQRVAFAFRIAVNNIAEEITNVAIRHGVDPRDFSLVAYGAAGPMLLPAALELLHVDAGRRPAAPGPLLGARPAQHRPRLLRQPQLLRRAHAGGGAAIAAVFEEMEAELRERVGAAAATATVRRSFDGRLYGQSWETPFVAVPDGPIDAETIPRLVEAFHEEYGRRYGNTLPVRPGAGRQLPGRADRPGREGRVRAARAAGRRRRVTPDRTVELRHLADELLEAGEYSRDGAAGRRPRRRARRSSARGCRRRSSAPGRPPTVGRLGEIVIERD